MQDLEEDIGLDRLEQALETAIGVEDKPSLIIVRTHIAQGSPNKQDTAGAHGSPLGEEEVKLTKEKYGLALARALLRPDGGARALPPLHRARRAARD